MKKQTKKIKVEEEPARKSPVEKGKMSISFENDIPTKIIPKKKILIGNQEKSITLSVSPLFAIDSPDEIQKKGKKKIFGGLKQLFSKKKNLINFPAVKSPDSSGKVEESDEVAVLENEIKQKLELIKQKQEEKRLKIEEEKIKIEEEKKRIEKEKCIKEKIPKTEIRTEQFNNLDEVRLIPENLSVKFCPKCSSKMKKKWVRNYGDILMQEFICKNKLCRNLIKLEINKF